MIEGEAMGVQRLAFERDRPQRIRTEHVSPFADQRVAAQARLDPDLVAPAGPKSHLDQ